MEPRFPGRDRVVAAGTAVGLVVVAIVLLTLPPGDLPKPAVTTPAAVQHQTPVIDTPAAVVATPPQLPPPPPPIPPAAAKPTTAEIVASALPKGSVVRVDGRPVSRRHVTVSAGRHVVQVTAAGFVPRTDTLQLSAGQKLAWAPALVALPPAKPGAVEPPVKRANPDDAICRQELANSNWREAFAACVRAGQAGSTLAARSVATMFQRGDGVRRSDDSAARWFGQAARSGDALSMYQLAIALERGRGVAKDQAAALDWYTRAANAGNADAEFAVGEAYEKGRLGVTKDRAKAVEWYKRAAAQGHKDAASRMRDLQR